MSRTAQQKTGDNGEQRAADFLVQKGFTISERNYRFKRAEIDLIVQNQNLLVFVEVKTRKNSDFGHPEEFVSERKQELFHEVATHYLEENDLQTRIRFDIISITGSEIVHFEDAF